MSKILTEEVARENIGKYIDCYSRIGIYPKKIIVFPCGDIAVKTSTGVCTRIDKFTHYDYIFTMSDDDDVFFNTEQD